MATDKTAIVVMVAVVMIAVVMVAFLVHVTERDQRLRRTANLWRRNVRERAISRASDQGDDALPLDNSSRVHDLWYMIYSGMMVLVQ